MTGPKASLAREGSDEVDELFDAARRMAVRSRGGTRPDWKLVWAEARRRRIRRVVLAVSAGALAAAAAAVLIVAPFRSAPSSAALPHGVGRLAGTDGASSEEYRFLLPSAHVRIVAEPGASLRAVSSGELSLTAGAVWVHVDGRSGRVPFAVLTPDARISVEGTRFAVSVDPGSGTTVAVLDGHVRARVAGRDVAVGADWEWHSGSPAPSRLGATWRASLESFFPGGAEAVPGPESGPPARVPVGPASVVGAPVGGGESGIAAVPVSPVAVPAPGRECPPAGGTDGDSGMAQPPVDTANLLFRRAEEAMAAGRVEEAIDLLGQAADVAPSSSLSGMALMELAAQARRLGRPEIARPAYERYLAEQPAGEFRGEARIALCRIHSGAGRTTDMRQCYATYLAEQPDGSYAAEAARGLEVAAGEDAIR